MTEYDLIKFHVPATFVLEHVMPTAAEVAYGFKHGWISAGDVVQIALAKLKAGMTLSASEEELALLLAQELDQVPDLIDKLEQENMSEEDASKVWLYLSLAWIYEYRSEYHDPLGMIDLLYTDFGYPVEAESMIGDMLAAHKKPSEPQDIETNWRAYIERKTEEYRSHIRTMLEHSK